ITGGMCMMLATGAMSLMKSNLRWPYTDALTAFTELTKRSVYPSAGARTAASVAMLPPAPERRLAQIEESVSRYLQQLDSADRQEPSLALATKTTRLKEKIAKLKEEMQRLHALKVRMLATPDQQISLTDPDARSMATSGRGSGVVGYNVQIAVDTEHHLIITHEVTNVGTDRSQLAHVAKKTKATLGAESLDVVADRGYFNGEEILACEEAGITVTLPKPMTSNSKAEGRFGKQDFRYMAG